ncbi:TetR/AcrR family transcriptional regulator, partial [Streptomyces sp. SID11233]|nr:TetR/AcrR family transcriptional regulator [Streptomyces sp. SID11233]
ELADGDVDRDAFLGRFAEQWRSLDSAEFPFVQQIAEEFAGHDDRDQFLAALELTLSGLRLQAGAE